MPLTGLGDRHVKYCCAFVWFTCCFPLAAQKTIEPRPNGIEVDRPKVFDNRTLTLMLESMNDSLRSVQIIDQKTLAAALGTFQGYQSRDTTSAFSITALPTPSGTTERVVNTGNIDKNGSLLPDTTQTTNTTSTTGVTVQAPVLEPAQTLNYSPTYGESALDLLTDQANLTYQIFTTRLLLERSLSDRLFNGKPRLQAVLGVDISIDPPRTANDAVAVVELTVTARDPQTTSVVPGLSVVSLMPSENAYNTAALSTKSHAFGARLS